MAFIGAGTAALIAAAIAAAGTGASLYAGQKNASAARGAGSMGSGMGKQGVQRQPFQMPAGLYGNPAQPGQGNLMGQGAPDTLASVLQNPSSPPQPGNTSLLGGGNNGMPDWLQNMLQGQQGV